MKSLLIVLLLFVYQTSFCQKDTVALKENVRKLDEALLTKDSVLMDKLLDGKVTFGHPNGWVESKIDILKDLSTGYLVYTKIESRNIRLTGEKDWASVRYEANVKGLMNYYTPFELKLHILQVWKRAKGKWRLIARQSTKVI